MKDRMWNSIRAMIAAMIMMTMGAVSLASAVQPQHVPHDNRVATRTVAEYSQGSWLAPATVVLDSKQAWDEWNCAQVANGRAVNAEAAPANVNWKREVLLVVALGENLNWWRTVKVKGAIKKGVETMVDIECALNAGGPSPSVVVALPRSHGRTVRLVPNVTLASDLPMKATYVMSSDGPSPMDVVSSWGALKNYYR